jgi:acyl dehydratase
MNDRGERATVSTLKGLALEDYEVGMQFRTHRRTITETDVVNFAGFSGDYNALHTDDEYARSTPYEGRIAHGMLGAAVSSGLANRLGIFEGTVLALLYQSLEYRRPILLGDTVHMEMVVSGIEPARNGRRGTVIFKTNLVNQRGKVVIAGQWNLLIRSRSDVSDASDGAEADRGKDRTASGTKRERTDRAVPASRKNRD